MFLFVLLNICIAETIISGQGDWKYQYMPELLQLPEGATGILNGHGLVQLNEGLFFTYQPTNISESTQALVRFDLSGKSGVMLGKPGPDGLSFGTPHGLRSEFDQKKNETFLYHANNGAMVWKTQLDGSIIWAKNFLDWQTTHPQYWPIVPTGTVVVPGTDILLLSDGYGSSYIHHINKYTGEYMNFTFGGTLKPPLRLHTPHNINLDVTRPGTIVIADRYNHRLVWVTPNGKFIREVPIKENGLTFPCDVNYYKDSKYGFVSTVPSLGDANGQAYINGSVGIFDNKQNLVSTIEVERFLGHLGHQHPHDSVFLPNGDLVICCWSGPSDGPKFGPSKGTISYWKLL